MIFTLGISVSLFLGVLIFLKKRKSLADKVLLTWLIVIAIHQLLFYLDYSGLLISKYGFLAGIILPFPLLHGPFLYIYISLMLKPSGYRNPLHWVHLLPFVLMNIYLIKFYKLPASEKLFVIANYGVGYESFTTVNIILILISGLGYILWSLLLIRKHQKDIKHKFSNIDKINLKWLQYLIYGLLFIWIIVFFGQDIYVFLAVVGFVLLIGIFGIKQSKIFIDTPLILSESDTSPEDKIKQKDSEIESRYIHSGLMEEEKLSIKENLTRVMDNERLYLDNELSLTMLSSMLNTHSNYISQFINEEMGMSFYDYVNLKRVNEFKHKISTPKYSNYKLIEVAYECGFSSKSSFNRNFKKVTGETPSEYHKKVSYCNMTPQN